MAAKSLMIGTSMLMFSAVALGQSPGFLGIRAKKAEVPARCATVEALAPGGPGERAGLLAGDVILAIDGVPVDCGAAQKGRPLVPNIQAKDRVVFGILRDGQERDVAIVAEAIPGAIAEAQDERARLEAGRAVFQKLVRTQEVFTVTLEKGGGFKISGKMTDEEAEQLHAYFAKQGDGAMFPKVMKSDRQEMYLRFDREKGAVQYEFVDAPKTPEKSP